LEDRSTRIVRGPVDRFLGQYGPLAGAADAAHAPVALAVGFPLVLLHRLAHREVGLDLPLIAFRVSGSGFRVQGFGFWGGMRER